MYIMYINASSNTTSYTHVSLYMVWRIQPPPPRLAFYTILIRGQLYLGMKILLSMFIDPDSIKTLLFKKLYNLFYKNYCQILIPYLVLEEVQVLSLEMLKWYRKKRYHTNIGLDLS